MKVLITTDWYTPAVNGVVASVLNLRRELENLGHEVRVLTLSQSPRSFFCDGVTYLGSLPAGMIYPGARLRMALAGKYIRDILQWGPDIVHSQCEFSTFFLARRIAEDLGVPLIHTYHTIYENYTHYFSPSVRWGRRAVMLFSRWIASRTDCMIAPTKKVQELLEGYQVDTPIRVVPTGIDLRRFHPSKDNAGQERLREALHIPKENLILVSVGRLAEEKNVSEILEELTAFHGAPLTLVLVGDGPYRENLEMQTSNLGLQNQVRFTGMVSPEQVPDYYNLGDLFVSASTSETQGLTYIEALSSGLPALCRQDTCLYGIVNQGINGWQYTGGSDFADKLTTFMERPDLRDSMHLAALKSAEDFGARRFAERMEAVYEEQIRVYPRLHIDLSA